VIQFRGVGKHFGAVEAVRPTDLTIAAGEFFTLLGPSGSGKTTLLNVTAGYVAPSTGRVLIGEADVTDLPPRHRNVGMVFQSYALFPHLDVFENVAYGLRVRRRPAAEIQRRVGEALTTLQLDGLGDRRITELSGGQQQRVALARALVIEPSVLLMDEPLGALDRQLRKQVQLELRHLHQRMGRTTLYVTHDQEEALVLSDRIGVMRAGRLEQVGTARELYERPASAFVAGFLGESNLLPGRLTHLDGDQAALLVPGWPAPIPGVAAPGLAAGAPATALIRPEHVRLGAEAPDPPEAVEAHVDEVVYLGDLVALRLRAPGRVTLWCRRFARDGVPAGETVKTGFRYEDVRILPD
jgi:ABC-type Fe3+/spermidine/putrescine transport system ATPase subunit